MNRLDKRNIPERLQEIKDMNSWSSQEMAMKANVTLPTIRNALEGLSALKTDTLIKVAEGLGVSPEVVKRLKMLETSMKKLDFFGFTFDKKKITELF